jgi:hypothetical protein
MLPFSLAKFLLSHSIHFFFLRNLQIGPKS